MVPCFALLVLSFFCGKENVMIDLHHDLLSILYYCHLHGREDYLKEWIQNFHKENVSGLLANLYYMSKEEMRKEMGEKEIDVLEMFQLSTTLFQKYLPNVPVRFSIEGCDYIHGVEELEELYKLGLRNILLVWNEPNRYGSGNRGDYGLTDEGKEFLIKAIDLGISIDMSHMNTKTFFDTIALIKEQKLLGKEVKVLASHSNSLEVCEHPRNLSEEQIQALKEVGGLLGLVAYEPFVRDENHKEDLKELYLSHIEKAVLMMGVDHVGISSDDMTFSIALFGEDYGNMVFDYSNIQKELKNLLMTRYSEEDTNKILFQNAYDYLLKEELK